MNKCNLGKRVFLMISIASVMAAVLSGCATSFDKRGRYHIVRSGESIWRIARVYRVDLQELAEYNNIFDPKDVQPGAHIYLPPREKKSAFKQIPADRYYKSPGRGRDKYGGKRGGEGSYSKEIKTFHGRFEWPVDGKVASQFGIRNGRRHDGIDITAKQGTPIKAADSGRVVFAGKMRGYGNLILIRHKDNFFTAYAHNNSNKVKENQDVKRGHVIGTVGRTGRATGSHLHFEIRNGQRARNPLFFLSERK